MTTPVEPHVPAAPGGMDVGFRLRLNAIAQRCEDAATLLEHTAYRDVAGFLRDKAADCRSVAQEGLGG